MNNPKTFLRHCFDQFVKAADPVEVLPPHLPDGRDGPAIVIGAGKAAARMARAFENIWSGPVRGAVVIPYGYQDQCEQIRLLEASHPTPDQNSILATRTITSMIENLSPDDNVFVMLSGGGSSLLCHPPQDISLKEKQSINKALLKSGASINEINTVRKHLSLIKGGHLAEIITPATCHSFVISDVVGNNPEIIASGPTVSDPSTREDAINVIKKYSLDCPQSISHWLENPASESIKEINPSNRYKIIASAQDALFALGEFCLENDVHVINLGELSGDAATLAQEHALIAKQVSNDGPTVIYSGGETTVNVSGNGKGGRNTEYLLSLAIALNGEANIFALAADSDGIDGNGDHAGAIITPDTLTRLEIAGLDAKDLLKENDSYKAFKTIDDLIMTGPTRTNVNDLRVILVLPSS